MAFPFEFVVHGSPVSQQARRRELVREWRQNVRNVAERYWISGDAPTPESVMLTVTYFFTDVQMDVDNIPKPISDALNGLVYDDDAQITDVLCRKRDLINTEFRTENIPPILREAIVRKMPFIHILVENAPNQSEIY